MQPEKQSLSLLFLNEPILKLLAPISANLHTLTVYCTEIRNKPLNNSFSMPPYDSSGKTQARNIHCLNALEEISFASAFHIFQDN